MNSQNQVVPSLQLRREASLPLSLNNEEPHIFYPLRLFLQEFNSIDLKMNLFET